MSATITLSVLACTLLVFLGSSLLGSAGAQAANVRNSFDVIRSLESLTKAVHGLKAEIQIQAELLNNSITEQNKQNTCFQNFEAEEAGEEVADQPMTNRTIVALTGDDVEIWCVTARTPLSQIKWKRENGTLDRVEYGNHGKTLRIKNVEVADSGTYVCDAADGAGTPYSLSISLQVYAQAQQCHTLIESDKGNLKIETLSAGCLLVIKLENTTGFRLKLDPLMTEPILVIPEQDPSNSNFQSVRIYGSMNVSHEFKGKSLAIVVPPGREVTTLNWTGLAVDDSRVFSSTEFKNDSKGTAVWEPAGEGTHKIFWAFELGVTGQFSWTLNIVDLASNREHSCESISLAVLEVSPDGNVREIEKYSCILMARTCEGSSIGYLMSERGSAVLILLHLKSIKDARSSLEVTWKHHGVPLKKNVAGILGGTSGSGVFTIPVNSTQTRLVSSGTFYGLAFDWNSRRIYKSQNGVGITRSNLDGSESMTLLSDQSSTLCGIAIDPISDNLYYGNRTSRTIRVCNHDATKCSLIANSSYLQNVWDIAVYPSKGLLFWSSWGSKIVRANLDGSNTTVLLDGLVIRGIDVDDDEGRLYWGSDKGIRSCDLNGQDIQTLPNLSTSIEDVAIDGDKVYYSNYSTNSIHAISKSGMSLSLLTKLTSHVEHIALFGTRVSNQPPNPCKISRCAHLCVVMSPSSFQCMCPEHRTLNEDGRTCQ